MRQAAKALKNAIKKEVKKDGGLSLRGIARLCKMRRKGKPVISTGMLSNFVKKNIVPKDKVIQYAMGIYEPKPKRIWNKSAKELQYCLDNRQPMKAMTSEELKAYMIEFWKG